MAIAKATGDLLSAAGYEVIYTREGDIDTDDLEFRADIANNAKADVFISIHCNAAGSAEVYGAETYHRGVDEESAILAAAIQRKLAALGYTRDHGVKHANFAVLRQTTMPAVLIECGFITSAHDRQTLTNPEGQEQIAYAIMTGIESVN